MKRRLLVALVLASCGSPPLVVDDAGVDATARVDANLPAPMPFMIALDDPSTHYRFELDTDPLGFRLLDASGAPVVTSGGLGLAVGLANRGDASFHEPMMDVP